MFGEQRPTQRRELRRPRSLPAVPSSSIGRFPCGADMRASLTSPIIGNEPSTSETVAEVSPRSSERGRGGSEAEIVDKPRIATMRDAGDPHWERFFVDRADVAGTRAVRSVRQEPVRTRSGWFRSCKSPRSSAGSSGRGRRCRNTRTPSGS